MNQESGAPEPVGDNWPWTIELTQGYIAVVDEEDFDRVSEYRWKILKTDGKLYASRSRKWPGGKYTTILMHREITAAEKGRVVDHWNGNGLDNRKENLRKCSQSQNLANMPSGGGSSQYKGVYFHKKDGKWQAQIGNGRTASGKQSVLYLGQFKTQEEAALAYNAKATEIHGEFARLNVLKGPRYTPPDIASIIESQKEGAFR